MLIDVILNTVEEDCNSPVVLRVEDNPGKEHCVYAVKFDFKNVKDLRGDLHNNTFQIVPNRPYEFYIYPDRPGLVRAIVSKYCASDREMVKLIQDMIKGENQEFFQTPDIVLPTIKWDRKTAVIQVNEFLDYWNIISTGGAAAAALAALLGILDVGVKLGSAGSLTGLGFLIAVLFGVVVAGLKWWASPEKCSLAISENDRPTQGRLIY